MMSSASNFVPEKHPPERGNSLPLFGDPSKKVIPCWAAIGPTRRSVGAQIHYARPASGSPQGEIQNAPF
ncbi:Uncharacterized protein TCM_024787 [Theobroma cacao]|uniref:Uncharacterized protein n=1 Tax=Theobroma cacao TaxID=3641 RepID=A0A061EY57_THECC|nr:Uncharacterized protein TCM_024787 [Theobroma cacao]